MEREDLNIDPAGQEAEKNSETEENRRQKADCELFEDDGLLLALVPRHLEHEEPCGEGGSDQQQDCSQVRVDLQFHKRHSPVKSSASIVSGASD